jgi:3-isopropylmalate/(R)-2-methylmalate dehydratase small subunit
MSGTPPFVRHTGRIAALDLANVDTDQIIPKQFLKRIERDGFGEFLFWEWRKDAAFALNRPDYAGATILAAGPNFGCGSSREHAAWAIEGAGFRAVVAASFGDIFRTNAGKIGLLAVVLPEEDVRELMALAPAEATVDLERQTVTLPSDREVPFAVDPDLRERLLHGRDEIDLTLQREAEIAGYEEARERPGPSTLVLG